MERESEKRSVSGDVGGENAQVEQNRAVATGLGMRPGRRSWLSKIEAVCSGKQYKQLFKNEMPVC